jgi:hypothetical protein
MLKNISILCQASGKNPQEVIDFVENTINKARYKKQIQFVFYIEKNRNNADVNKAVNDLYMKYPPDIFDADPLPTIKAVIGEAGSDTPWDEACAEKSDAPLVLPAAFVTQLLKEYSEDWDMHFLDTTPRQYHHLKTEEEV